MTGHRDKPATPAQPAAYIRVASAGSPDDLPVQQQRHTVLSAAAALGWPAPTVYTDTGTPGWDRHGSALATLAGHIRAGQHDAVITADLARISRTPGDLAAFHALCHEHGVTWHTLTGGPVTPGSLAILGGIA
jgi:DNA invertase Pin-like site-specific DNA recombinase